MPMILGYWDIRGLAHAIRLLLEYTDSSYEEKQYSMGDGNVGTSVTAPLPKHAPMPGHLLLLLQAFRSWRCSLQVPEPWHGVLGSPGAQLTCVLPTQLPYLIDGSHKITQSNAILRYIARKHNLCGETEEERIRVDMLHNQAVDTCDELARVCYSPDFYLAGLPDKLKLYSQFLGKRPWFAGDKITFVDFFTYDVLDIHRIFEPKCLDAFPNLKEFMSRFEGLKKISAYMKSSRFLPRPVYSKMAVWGSK
ncbi:Glutathione S-transferase Mu 1 [Tupaia chinensis]|uniref:glutathione transferase n=1 Tax=Tupaia chinensis TaxID=246437 RepID=L9KQW7_TUPCH|nr:Glutathione S-transferase Mu 1 [Tupaia chinensis]